MKTSRQYNCLYRKCPCSIASCASARVVVSYDGEIVFCQHKTLQFLAVPWHGCVLGAFDRSLYVCAAAASVLAILHETVVPCAVTLMQGHVWGAEVYSQQKACTPCCASPTVNRFLGVCCPLSTITSDFTRFLFSHCFACVIGLLFFPGVHAGPPLGFHNNHVPE